MASVCQGGFIFIGDVRDYRLIEYYHASVQEYKASSDLTGVELRQLVHQHASQEEELLLDPAFFYGLRERFPKISNVRVYLKYGRYQNELTRFRYDVVIEIGEKGANHEEIQWLDCFLVVRTFCPLFVLTVRERRETRLFSGRGIRYYFFSHSRSGVFALDR